MKQYLILLLSLTVMLFAGCGKRQEVPVKHIHLLAAMKTAISIESPKQINVCRETINKEKENNELSSSLEEELQQVLQYADKGEWKQAEKEIRKLQKRYIVDSTTVQHHDHKEKGKRGRK